MSNFPFLKILLAEIHGELLLNFVLSIHDDKMIYFVSGAFARSVYRTRKCDFCKETLTDDSDALQDHQFDEINSEVVNFMKLIDRGGLLTPKEYIFTLCQLCWRVYFEIKETLALKSKFIYCEHQTNLFCEIMDISIDKHFDIFFGKTHCTKGHNMIRDIVVHFFNTMSKNFVKESSQILAAKQKRKIDKLASRD